MASYSQKLANMRSRRLGLDTSGGLVEFAALSGATALNEVYETRAKTEAVKYALGAMQELEPKYTQISFQEGDRVKGQLESGLKSAMIPATFEYQGSVPLNIHIRFASDIDLLVLHDGFVTVDSTGPRATTYVTLAGSVLDDMVALRRQCEVILEEKFPAVSVDKSGGKSIALSGGSLKRKVDVVPSHWHDTATYQASRAKHDREVRILNKDERTLIKNHPFMHMRRIEEKDLRTSGGAKKVIRFLKNLKKDASAEIKLSSYDLASLVWHCPDIALTKPYYLELSLVAEAQRHLQYLCDNPELARRLDVPDLSRKILDAPEKLVGLRLLKAEVDQVAEDIARELQPFFYASQDVIQRSLMKAQIY